MFPLFVCFFFFGFVSDFSCLSHFEVFLVLFSHTRDIAIGLVGTGSPLLVIKYFTLSIPFTLETGWEDEWMLGFFLELARATD